MRSNLLEKETALTVELTRLNSNRGDQNMNTVRHPHRFIAVLFPLVVLTVFALMPVASARAANCYVYGVNIQGTAAIGDNTAISGSQQFSVLEYAVVRDTGYASNPVEFLLTPNQDLNLSPQVGHIELMTNSAIFARNLGIQSARYDLARVSVSNVISFALDSGISFQLPSPNVFVAPGIGSTPGGLGGLGFLTGAGGALAQIVNGAQILSVSYFVPRTGNGYFYSPDGSWSTIAGQLSIGGTGIDNASFQGYYEAQFSGNYLGTTQCD